MSNFKQWLKSIHHPSRLQFGLNLKSFEILLLILLPLGFSSAARSQSYAQLGLVDPIVGAYSLVISAGCVIPQPISQSSCILHPECCPLTNGNEILSADGTSSGQDTGAIGGPGIFGRSGFATAHTGIWKYIGKVKGLRTYTWILFNAVVYPGQNAATAFTEFNTPVVPPTNNCSTIFPGDPSCKAPQLPYAVVGWLPVVITATLLPNGNLALSPAIANFIDNNFPDFSHIDFQPGVGSGTGYSINFSTFGK